MQNCDALVAVVVSKARNCRFSRDVTAAMLVYRTIEKKVSWEFNSIIVLNFSAILPLFCTPTWPSHHVNEKKEFFFSRASRVPLS